MNHSEGPTTQTPSECSAVVLWYYSAAAPQPKGAQAVAH